MSDQGKVRESSDCLLNTRDDTLGGNIVISCDKAS